MIDITIRKETAADIEAIASITREAFAEHPYSAGTEEFIVEALRAAGALSVSLVAVVDGDVVGHIAFSPVTVSDGRSGWYGVGPVSVVPRLQRQGIGKALVREGVEAVKGLGGKGCVLVGDPGYYGRFGFKGGSALTLPGVPPEYFQVLVFGEEPPAGIVAFHRGFSAKGPVE